MINQLYPFSTKEGEVIPLDIIRPSKILRIAYAAGVASAVVALGVTTPVLILRATTACFVRFGVTAAVIPTDATLLADTIYIEPGELVYCAPGLTSISVIGDTLPGALTVQLIEQWAGLGHEAAYSAS